MLLWSLVFVASIVSGSGPPVHFADVFVVTDKDGQFHIESDSDNEWHASGTVWLDENDDGIRQPSEPRMANETIRVQYLSRFLRIWAVYRDMGAGRPTWYGCAFVKIPPELSAVTFNIRVSWHPEKRFPLDRSTADGHFFAHAGEPYCDSGYEVTNADGIPFWDTWQRLGLENVGYPISHRYMWRGGVTQAFQKAIMRWQRDRGVILVNIFDELHEAGFDDKLRESWGLPQQSSPALDSALPVDKWEELGAGLREKLRADLRRTRLALLDANQAIKERYFAARDPLLLFGLPTSRVEEYGNMFVIRTQKAVLQQWKEDVPWAKAGEVTIANGGEIAYQVGRRCQYVPSGPDRCTYLFFPRRALDINGPGVLIPQHIDVIDPP